MRRPRVILFPVPVLPLFLGIVALWAAGVAAFEGDSKWNSAYSQGRKLYLTQCAACHGQNGEGAIGLPLNLQSFLSVAPEGYIRRSIFYGRLPRQMPPYASVLKKEEIEAISAYVRSWQVRDYVGLDVKRVAGSVSNGKLLFNGLCAGCHGSDGLGGPQVGGGHVTNAMAGYAGPALNNPGFLKSATDGYIKATMMQGRVGTPMGAYLKGKQGMVELAEEEINDIVAYIRTWETRDAGSADPWRDQ
ncbi:MAG: c-type cytochrome [Candidatus Tectomicrobia bacterium]|nr:c-type cytochrome [Candidatus Tectomicrobia bacterium]